MSSTRQPSTVRRRRGSGTRVTAAAAAGHGTRARTRSSRSGPDRAPLHRSDVARSRSLMPTNATGVPWSPKGRCVSRSVWGAGGVDSEGFRQARRAVGRHRIGGAGSIPRARSSRARSIGQGSAPDRAREVVARLAPVHAEPDRAPPARDRHPEIRQERRTRVGQLVVDVVAIPGAAVAVGSAGSNTPSPPVRRRREDHRRHQLDASRPARWS